MSPLVEKLNKWSEVAGHCYLGMNSAGNRKGFWGDVNNKSADFACYEFAITATSLPGDVFREMVATCRRMPEIVDFERLFRV